MPDPSDATNRAQVAEIGRRSPSYHVMTSQEVHKLYSDKKVAKTNAGRIVFTFSDVQFSQDQWHKVESALAATA